MDVTGGDSTGNVFVDEVSSSDLSASPSDPSRTISGSVFENISTMIVMREFSGVKLVDDS